MEHQPTNLLACSSEARRLFYDRVGRYFFRPEAISNQDVCPKCGQSGILLERAGKTESCVAYRSIVAKRHAPADDELPVFGVARRDPDKRGMATFGESAYALIEADRSFVACNVVPVAPLPETMTAVRSGLKHFRAIIRQLIETPPTKPYLFVAFSRAADFPMILSRPGDIVWLNQAPQPISLSISRLASTLAFYEANEADLSALAQMAHLRRDLASGIDTAGVKLNKILKRKPALAQKFASLPDASQPETGLAASLFHSAKKETVA